MDVVDTRRSRLVAGLAVALLAIAIAAPDTSAVAKTRRISVDSSGDQGNGESSAPKITPNGRWVVFESRSDDLVPNDSNGEEDIFLRDRKKRKTKRVSLGPGRSQLNRDSTHADISADGRFVVFASRAVYLGQSDVNGTWDVFLHDRRKGTTRLISRNKAGEAGDGASQAPAISADGRIVVFASSASDLVGADTNGDRDIFIYIRAKKKLRRVSVDSAGRQGSSDSFDPEVSADGRFVVFKSDAWNLVKDDDNGTTDVFIRDRKKRRTRRISVSSSGKEGNGPSGNPRISPNGRFVVFDSSATNFAAIDSNVAVDVFRRDRRRGKTKRVSVSSGGVQGNVQSNAYAVSNDGRYILFHSAASTLVPNDTNGDRDVFIRDQRRKRTTRITRRSDGGQGDGSQPAWSADGRFIVFRSEHPLMVPNDTNLVADIFIRGPRG